MTLDDIYDRDTNKFMPYKTLVDNQGQTIDLLMYYCLVSAIPSRWKQQIKSQNIKRGIPRFEIWVQPNS